MDHISLILGLSLAQQCLLILSETLAQQSQLPAWSSLLPIANPAFTVEHVEPFATLFPNWNGNLILMPLIASYVSVNLGLKVLVLRLC